MSRSRYQKSVLTICATLSLTAGKTAWADCSTLRCTSYDFGLPVNITNSGSAPSLTVMDGNVGIGTTSPSQLLDVVGGYMRISREYSSGIYLHNSTTGNTFSIFNASSAANGFSGLGIFDGTGYRLAIVDGNVGVGTLSPSAPLEVAGGNLKVSNYGTAGLVLGNNTTSVNYAFYNGSSGSTGFNGFGIFDGTDYRFSIVSGSVGIGNTSPSYTLDVTGTMRVTGQAYTNSGNGSFSVLSDARFKTIKGPYRRGLDDLRKIEVLKFNYNSDNPLNADSSKTYVGITAQNLKTAIPEAVTEENGYLTTNTSPVLWTLVNGTQELAEKIDSLQSENSKLKSEVAQLKIYLCAKDSNASFCH